MANTIFSTTAQWEPCKSLGFASIGAGYTAIGTPFAFAPRSVFIQNLTNATLWFSNDGVNDKFPLLPNAFIVWDFTTNKSQMQGLYLPALTQMYVKELGTPTSGSVYVTSMYGSINP